MRGSRFRAHVRGVTAEGCKAPAGEDCETPASQPFEQVHYNSLSRCFTTLRLGDQGCSITLAAEDCKVPAQGAVKYPLPRGAFRAHARGVLGW